MPPSRAAPPHRAPPAERRCCHRRVVGSSRKWEASSHVITRHHTSSPLRGVCRQRIPLQRDCQPCLSLYLSLCRSACRSLDPRRPSSVDPPVSRRRRRPRRGWLPDSQGVRNPPIGALPDAAASSSSLGWVFHACRAQHKRCRSCTMGLPGMRPSWQQARAVGQLATNREPNDSPYSVALRACALSARALVSASFSLCTLVSRSVRTSRAHGIHLIVGVP